MAQSSRPDRQAVGVHHLAVGDIAVTALNDGQFEGAFDWLVGVEAAEATKLHQASFRALPPRVTVNAFLVHLPDRLVLVDAGCGGVMGPDMGRLAANLTAIGVAPGDVDTVLATHLHPDHVGGLVDGEGRAVFPNAELVVHEAEPRFWGDDATLAGATEANREFVMLARATMAAYGNRMRQVAGGGAARRHRGAGAEAHAGPYRVAGRVGRGLAADLGRHRAPAGGAVRAAGGGGRVRCRRRPGNRDAAADHGHGRDRPAACGRHAPGFPGVRARGAGRAGVCVRAGGLAAWGVRVGAAGALAPRSDT